LTRSGLAVDAASRAPTVLLLGSAAGCALLAFAARRGVKPLIMTSIALLSVGFVVGITLFGNGLAFVGRQGVVGMINESFPLFRDIERAIGEHSLWLFALPLISLQIMRKADPARFAIGSLSLLGFILACYQARFAVIFMLPGAIAIGIVFDQIWQRSQKKLRLALVIGTLVALVPSGMLFAKTHLVRRTTAAVYEASEWLEKSTRPHAPRRADTRADFSLASMWDDGNIIAYIGRTPVILGAMFSGDHERALKDDLAILFGDHPERLIQARKVRYILVRSFSGGIERKHRKLLGLRAAKHPTLSRQLYTFDGSAATTGSGQAYLPARGHWRLIYESPLTDPVTKKSIVKIFEHVASARLYGRCLGDEPVFARIRVTTYMRRRFFFIAASPCKSGSFSLRIPYAGRVDLAQGKHRLSQVTVDETAVRQGKALDATR
ncbi:MAG: hypothetical protein KAI47_25690, partial [Deltaproteobacteria bacterium]|nr:hypothetical protein [Deltaproteobacteria bacterium]